ncbi:ribonuclease M5 [Tetzosporium hominis]|uniref:Ribonuclease M5 n=1 Tax=Tetzosporium hominis TaxID=2020506 RepID=A0A264W5U2_9BACL|nr:ribonuclease M5 [Tetzosporium hominis]OZS78911.1 ribonuclease M5 [Tetzosporium hominis]
MDIKEIIVVEGKDDTTAIRRAVQADTIETNGSAVTQETLKKIKRAQEARGVIIFTDPDYPGRRIRALIEQAVPDVKHAFLPKRQAIAKNGNGLGIEHATDEAIRHALEQVYTPEERPAATFTKKQLLDAKLIGHPDSARRREVLGDALQIGYTNGKQLLKRLDMFRITQEEWHHALKVLEQEDGL